MTEKNSKTTEYLLNKNREKSTEFNNPLNKSYRQFYREVHPTEICAYKCMDGRLNFPFITEIPQGIIQPYRQIAGVFDLGDPYLGSLIEGWVKYAISKKRKCLALSTYHFSRGDHHRGCAGHGENTEEALKWAKGLVNQHIVVFGERSLNSVVYPVVVGIETDFDGLVFHGDSGKVFSVFENLDLNDKKIATSIEELYPLMSPDIMKDLMMLVLGNYKHVREIIKEGKDSLELVHGESIICIGRGFSWLHEPNKALIIGPYNNPLFSVEDAIETAGKIILGNVKAGRVSKSDGVTVMCSSLFYEEGMNKARETVKAYSLYRVAKKVLSEKVPELKKYNLQFIVGSTKQDDLLFRQVDPEIFEKAFEKDVKPSEEELFAISSKVHVSEN